MPAVKPEILSWARDTAGLSIEEAAQRLGRIAAVAPHRLTSLVQLNRKTIVEQPELLALTD